MTGRFLTSPRTSSPAVRLTLLMQAEFEFVWRSLRRLGLSVADVARETGVPVGTTKARLARGRTALARLLAVEPIEVTDV